MTPNDTNTELKLLLSNNEAATALNIAPITLRISRSTGSLLGVPAPKHIKFAKAVRYRLKDIQEWLDALDTDGKEGM
ncbi:hypothetical protein [Alteromonas sp. RKMC-009]|uniref:hypothetical protein n=1 Tax=Alteromonas sp. RKMC-009 TaxID=2267264 RepID=UPI000E677856|nr:hypothetical protein [Alteromonas sp. RKMC-009]AYA64777.1 hypothetical protein DS731_12595 [Alteromonas sp. RKMC-009]